MAHNLRIVPAKTGSSDAMGTEVWVGEHRLEVSSIILRADAITKVWRATIEAEAQIESEILSGTDGS